MRLPRSLSASTPAESGLTRSRETSVSPRLAMAASQRPSRWTTSSTRENSRITTGTRRRRRHPVRVRSRGALSSARRSCRASVRCAGRSAASVRGGAACDLPGARACRPRRGRRRRSACRRRRVPRERGSRGFSRFRRRGASGGLPAGRRGMRVTVVLLPGRRSGESGWWARGGVMSRPPSRRSFGVDTGRPHTRRPRAGPVARGRRRRSRG